jgi:lactoylglutathione lyase
MMARFVHTMIYVDDMAASIDFYTRTLGLRLLQAPRLASAGDVEMAFVGSDWNASVELMRPVNDHPPYEIGNRYGHLALEIDGDVRQTVDELRSQGVKVVREPWFGASGRWLAYIADPNGVTVELMERHEHA